MPIHAAFKSNPRRILGLILLLLFISASGVVHSQDTPVDQEVYVIGTGAVQGENIASGREQAIAGALVSAVNQVVIELISTDAIIHNFQLINDALYLKTNKFIQDYKVLTESAGGTRYRVLVQATVSSAAITQSLSELGLLVSEKSLPKVLFFIAEQPLDRFTPIKWWQAGVEASGMPAETAMTERLAESGYIIVDRSQLTLPADRHPDPGDQELIDLGRLFGAQVIIVGQAVARIAPNVMGETMKSFDAVIEARALRVDTGEVIGLTNQTAVTADAIEVEGGNRALDAAGLLAAGDLERQIVTAWITNEFKPTAITLLVEGTGGSIANFVKFRGTVSGISGVNSIKVQEISSQNATIEVTYQGTAKALADTLMTKTYSGFHINIQEMTHDSMRIQLLLD